MKKKILKFGLLLIPLFATCITSCNGGGSDPTPEVKYPTMHEVNKYDRPDRVFTKADGTTRKTDFQIIYDGENSQAIRAATFIASQLFSASGAEFKSQSKEDFIKGGGSVSTASKLIIVGCDDLFSEAKLTYPTKLKSYYGGYYIKNDHSNFYIQAKDNYGYQMGALAFLRNTVGYDMIEEDTVIFVDKNIDTLPDMEIIEAPDFEQSTPTNHFTSGKKYGVGFPETYPFMYTWRPDDTRGSNWHNVFDFLPTEMYMEEHPEWYSTGAHTQLCYSARGNESSYKEMVQKVADVTIASLNKYTDQNIINFTQNDIGDVCECDSCKKHKEEDGAASGQVIRFVNDVDDIVQKYLEEQAEKTKTEKRTFHIQFFAYLGYQTAPTTTVEKDPSLKCNSEVMICIAPLHAKYVNSFYDEVNKEYANQFTEWNKYCDNITAWLYETNYHHYMYPYNSYSTMMDNYRFVRENGAKIMLNEGQRKSENVTCFGKLKEYLCAKSQFDVTSSFNFYSNRFFDAYYKDASEIMRSYFEELIAWETQLEANPENGLGGGVYEEIGSQSSFWPKQLLLNWLSKMDEAEQAITKYKSTDEPLYNTLLKHINIERLFPLFCLCDRHADTYTESGIKELRLEFKALADELGLIEFAEHDGDISIKYSEWGIV